MISAILGGAFDPPHRGHIEMAETVLKSGYADEIVLMPCYTHNFNKFMTPPEHRLKMCMELCTDKIRVNTFEIDNKLDGKTLTLLTALELEQEPDKITMVIGSDNANCFPKWYHHETLLRKIRFIVVPRKGMEMTKETTKLFKSPHVILDQSVTSCSSTGIRKLLKEWWSNNGQHHQNVLLTDLLNPAVFKYIQENKLYQ